MMQLSAEAKLCTACGLCCTAFFSKGFIQNKTELGIVKGFGGAIYTDEEEQLCFHQPCPAHHGSCSVYPEHPASCQRFECALLKQLKSGEIMLGSALSHVQSIQGAISQIDITLLPLLGVRNVTTIDYMRQFFRRFESENNIKALKQHYAPALLAHAVYIFLRNKYFVKF